MDETVAIFLNENEMRMGIRMRVGKRMKMRVRAKLITIIVRYLSRFMSQFWHVSQHFWLKHDCDVDGV